jgi:UDP-N-acetylmuramoyl-tripeptide--D-alanyl-D-alanine ligase
VSLVDLTLALALAGWVPFWTVRLIRRLHIFQLEEYLGGRFFRWWLADLPRSLPGWLRLAVASLIALAVLPLADAPPWLAELALAGWGVLFGFAFLRRRSVAAKKPLVWTARARRLIGLTLILAALVVALVLTPGVLPAVGRPGGLLLTLGLLLAFDGPLLVAANALAQPFEASLRAFYRWRAGRRLRQVAPFVIGVTGSYGKTSTKEITAGLLAAQAPTLKPPGSYNTLMGICLTINRWLAPQHRFFVVEMGAYGRGDIRALCQLVRPRVGVLTAIGPEHLERFGSLEAIEQTKYELVEALPADGFAVMNVDDPRVRRLADQTRHVRVIRYGLDPAAHPEVTATEITTGPSGVQFLVRRGEEQFWVRSRLLGRHNVLNLLAGIAVARELGVSVEQVVAAVATLAPPEHRLQLISTPGGPTIIDDAYNANPAGVRAALEVLQEFPAGKRVLVTPGMVELGPLEAEENERFGALAAAVCDVVILVGPKRTLPIQRGLLGAGFPPERLIVVRSLAEATERLRGLVGAGDVVLFCNDLPDQYNE